MVDSSSTDQQFSQRSLPSKKGSRAALQGRDLAEVSGSLHGESLHGESHADLLSSQKKPVAASSGRSGVLSRSVDQWISGSVDQ